MTAASLFAGMRICAQDNSGKRYELTETVSAQLNATVFVSGETLYYKVNCTDASDKPSNLSRLAYAELVSVEKKAVFTHKFFLEDGSGRGDFFIPPSLPSGNYKFIAYTHWMLNSPASGYFQADITIVNPFLSSPKSRSATETTTPVAKPVTSGLLIQLPGEVQTRAKVEAKIVLPGSAVGGNYVLSVRKKDALNSLSGSIKSNSDNVFRFSPEARYLPELRGELFTGKVTAKDGTPAPNTSVALSIPGKKFAVKAAQTDAAGRFGITLEKPYHNKLAIVQVIGKNRGDFSVVLDPQPHPDYSGLVFGNYRITSEFEGVIREHAVASQIENAYYMHRADTVARQQASMPFYANLGKTFVLDQYTRFPTFRETIIEVIEDTYFIQNGSSYTLHVREHVAGGEIPEPSLVVMDGIYIEDATELFDYPAKNIEKITTIAGTYYFGPKAYSGVISIETVNGDYTPKTTGAFLIYTELLRPLQPKKYFAPDYSAKPNERIPDHRIQLVWQPNLPLAQTETVYSFYTSDVKGTFEAVLEGVSANGDRVFATTEFSVK